MATIRGYFFFGTDFGYSVALFAVLKDRRFGFVCVS